MTAEMGFSSENAAHRIAVLWDDEDGAHEGVYIPRRDTSSLMNHLAGGWIFPGEHYRATFNIEERDNHIQFRMESADHATKVEVSASVSDQIQPGSCFRSLQEASAFFSTGSLGYSATSSKNRLDGIRLKTYEWKVEPLVVEHVYSSYFADASVFPRGSVWFDCALIMRNVQHEWHAEEDLYVESPS
jgi:hypothetical protein